MRRCKRFAGREKKKNRARKNPSHREACSWKFVKKIKLVYHSKEHDLWAGGERRRKQKLSIVLTMFAMGLLLGFIGAGGSGFIIAILTVLFKIPIHTALGTSLTAMAFTSLSGAYSHFRQGNTAVGVGLVVGIFGAIGSYIGSKIATVIPSSDLHWLTAGMLFLSSILLLIRLSLFKKAEETEMKDVKWSQPKTLMKAMVLGIAAGILSGTFGIGSTPFIQLGLLTLLGLTIRQSVGTTMLVILPIAIGGGTGYRQAGYLDWMLLMEVLVGTMTGAYVGAKFTNLAPKSVLKAAMVLTPAVAALLLLIQ
jgi:uncharacterized membrane protein YfcA